MRLAVIKDKQKKADSSGGSSGEGHLSAAGDDGRDSVIPE